jgi:hypothetical protein
MKTKTTWPAGLFLWNVTIECKDPDRAYPKRVHLWITSPANSAAAALAKAKAYLKENRDSYPSAAVIKIKQKGTIDA